MPLAYADVFQSRRPRCTTPRLIRRRPRSVGHLDDAATGPAADPQDADHQQEVLLDRHRSTYPWTRVRQVRRTTSMPTATGRARRPQLPLTQVEQQLLRISKASQKQLSGFRDGVFITASTAKSIDDLRDQTCADRIALAETFLAAGERFVRGRPPEYRSAISRFYYAMYHSMRATAFFTYDGDDHQRHEALPQHTPKDFPTSAIWENRLKDARGRRNDADYDPYPLSLTEFRQPALELRQHARDLIPLVRTYLTSKGCGTV